MSSRLGEWNPTGPADPSRARAAGGVDTLIALLVAMIAWPFPIARATLPWMIHVALLLVAITTVDVAVRFIALRIWGRTLAMYLFDLGLVSESGPGIAKSIAWAATSALTVWPSLLGLRGLAHPESGVPARISGLVTRSTR